MAIGSPTLGVAEPYLIQQDFRAYTPEQHATWGELVGARMPQIETHACQEYVEGFHKIGLRAGQIPNLAEVNEKLRPLTGWRATPVSGFLPPDAFFAMLAARQFPTTTWLRSRESLAYIPEPDIFHDVFGHVPMHAHPVFADFLQHYGVVCAALTDKDALERMGRLFWFTVEFGVIRQHGGYRLYGSGLISSQGESNYVIEGGPEIRPFDVDQVLNQEFSTLGNATSVVCGRVFRADLRGYPRSPAPPLLKPGSATLATAQATPRKPTAGLHGPPISSFA